MIHRYVSPERLLACTVLLSLLIAVPVHAQPTGYQEYYVLGYEEHVWRSFLAINDGDDAGIDDGRICSTVSLVATADHQVVYYDHWEDGYEADLSNPVQSTTAVYGDGDPSNGGTGNDLLLAGDAVNLTSDQDITGPDAMEGYVPVNPNRDPTDIRYDGGDRIIASGGPVDLTHAMWPLGNSWAGGAWEVYSREAYAGTYSYHLPIGEDLYDSDQASYGDFRDVFLQLSAFEDNTTVSIDNGEKVVNLTLDRGATYSSMGQIDSTTAPTITINSGTVIRTNKPAQVGLMTGAEGNFQGRFLIVLPDQQWGADYVVPVPRGDSFHPTEIYLSNPNDFPITINAYDAEAQSRFTVAPNATVPYSDQRDGLGYTPEHSAARFTSADGVFGVVVCVDTANTTYDWGFSGVPNRFLTRDYYISWAPGTTDLSDNGSPIWVTPVADDTTFYVDYSPLNGTVDETFTLDVLEQRRIFDPDNDNTGMHVWATGEFAVVWGEDPRTADISDPYLDLGYTTLPLNQRWLDPVLTLDKRVEPTTLPPEGGAVTVTASIQAHNYPLVDVDVTDTLPSGWRYVPGSAIITYPDGSTDNREPAVDGSVLSWELSADLEFDETINLTFQTRITETEGITTSINRAEATGRHAYADTTFNPSDEARIYISPLLLTQSVSKDTARIGDTLAYTLTYINASDSLTATNTMLRDALPLQHVTFQSASDGGAFSGASGTIAWSLGTLKPGESGSVTFTVAVNDFVEDETVIENSGAIKSDQTVEAHSNTARTTIWAPKIELIKSGPTVAARGQVITYTLSYENGGGAEATDVTIHDAMSAPTTYVTDSLAINRGTGWVPLTDPADGDAGAYVSPTLVITPGTIAAGERGEIRFSAQIDDDLPSGSLILNAATFDRALDIPRVSNLVVTRIFDLLIHKSAKQSVVAPGGTISYTLTYENDSLATSQTDVYVRERIPDYTRLLPNTASGGDAIEYSYDNGTTWVSTLPITPVTHIRWHDADVPADTQETVEFAVQVNEVLPEGTTIENMAHASSAEMTESLLQSWIPSNRVKIPTVDIWIEKSASQATAQAGEIISYTLTYGNRGSANAADVQIQDTLTNGLAYDPGSIWGTGADDSQAPELAWDLGVVAAGSGARQVGYAATVDSALSPGMHVTNTASISNAQGAETSTAVTVTIIATEADLSIAKRYTPEATTHAGDVLTYTLSYTNAGPSDANGMTLTDTLPVSVTYGGMVNSPLPAPTRSGRHLIWHVQSLASSVEGTIVYTVTVRPDTQGVITNSAVITSTTPDPLLHNNNAHEGTEVYLPTAISKTAVDVNGEPLYPGDEIEYAVTVLNTSSYAQRNIIVADPAPANTTLITDTIQCTPGATCRAMEVGPTANADVVSPADFGGMAVALFDALGAGETLTLTFRARVNEDATSIGGNVAVTECDNQSGKGTPSIYPPSGSTVEPGLDIAKIATIPREGTLSPGTVIEYTIAVTNTNAAFTQQNVAIDDPLPENTTLVTGSTSCSAGAHCGVLDGRVTGTVNALGPGDSITLTFQVTANESADAIGENTAAVQSDNQNRQETPPVVPPSSADVPETIIYLPVVMRDA